MALECLDSDKWRPVGAESPKACRDNDGATVDRVPGCGLHLPATAISPRQADGLFPQVITRPERRRLLRQPVNQILRLDAWITGNVEYRLLGVEGATLPAQDIQGIDHMGADLQHAAFEDGEKSDGAGADYDNIRAVLYHPLFAISTVHGSSLRHGKSRKVTARGILFK